MAWTVLFFISNVKPVVSFLTFTSPRVEENVNVSLILLNSGSVIVAFACVISRSILVLLTVGVYFAACVLTLKTTRYGFEATLSLLPDLSLILFSAASIAEAYRVVMTSSSFQTVFADFSLFNMPVTFNVYGALVIVSPFRVTLL